MMRRYPIVPKDEDREQTAGRLRLPLFYMGDYSLIGLRVDDCDAAQRILDRHAFPLDREADTTWVGIDSAAAMRDVVQLLTGGGVHCEIADMVDGIYQG